MKVLLLGGHGMMGPPLVQALEGEYDLRVTDVVPVDTPHESMQVDVADLDQVMAAAEGVDVIVNLAVLRPDRKLAFDVNTLGTYNAVRAAVEHKTARFINTGPHYAIAGPDYTNYDFQITPEVPPHPGLGLYAISKAAGQEVCRIFAAHYPVHVLSLLFRQFDGPRAARAIKAALEVDLASLPSNNEVFFVVPDPPGGCFSTEKTQRLLGFQW